MSRTTRTNFKESFRLVLTHSWGVEYKGPYQTLAAVKGQLTSETAGRWQSTTTGHIERMTGDWEKVEA